MAWSAGEKRRRRYLADLEDYVRSCELVNEGTVQEAWTRFVLSKMPPMTFMGLFTFPETFGGADRRRWTFHRFMEEWSGQGHYLAAEEPHQSGDLHFHAVGAEHFRHLSMHDAWRVRTDGGFARIEKPRVQEDAVGYCVKYVAKGYLSGQSDLRLGELVRRPPFEARSGRFKNPWRPRRPEECVG